jgi:hypothetical protein
MVATFPSYSCQTVREHEFYRQRRALVLGGASARIVCPAKLGAPRWRRGLAAMGAKSDDAGTQQFRRGAGPAVPLPL